MEESYKICPLSREKCRKGECEWWVDDGCAVWWIGKYFKSKMIADEL